MKEWPTVAIVTPSYQQGEFIEETIRSVLLQGYPKLSYSVMDGGSTDGSVETIEKYAPWLTTWASEPDGGQAAAIDKGFDRINGEVLLWLNSDDVLAPGALWRAVEEFVRQPQLVLVYGDADETARDSTWLRRAGYTRQADRQYLVHVANAIAQPAAAFRRSAYEAVGRLDHDLHYGMDYDLWIRLADYGPIAYIPTTLAHLRIYPEAKSSSGHPAMFEELRAVGHRYGGFGHINQVLGWVGPGLISRAQAAWRDGDVTSGGDWLTAAIDNDPAWRSERRLASLIVDEAWRLVNAGRDTKHVLGWVKAVCRTLPATNISPARLERQALGLLYHALAFASFRQRRTGEVLAYALRAFVYHAQTPGRRGLLAISMRSMLKNWSD